MAGSISAILARPVPVVAGFMAAGLFMMIVYGRMH
jgi:hypothetical protein